MVVADHRWVLETTKQSIWRLHLLRVLNWIGALECRDLSEQPLLRREVRPRSIFGPLREMASECLVEREQKALVASLRGYVQHAGSCLSLCKAAEARWLPRKCRRNDSPVVRKVRFHPHDRRRKSDIRKDVDRGAKLVLRDLDLADLIEKYCSRR